MQKHYLKIILLAATVLTINSALPAYKAYAVDSSVKVSDSTLSSKADNKTITENNTNTEKNTNNSTNSKNNFPKSDLMSNNTVNNNSTSLDNLKTSDDMDTPDSDAEKEPFIDYGWKVIDNKKYYIVDNKILEQTKWFYEKDVNPNLKKNDEHYDDIYYLNNDFSVTVGWKKINNNWYFFNNDGIMQTGLISDGGHSYYTDDSGIMQTGWQKIDGSTYYFNESSGEMAVGKVFLNDSWYFFNSQGQLEKGFYYNNNKMYYSENDGKMVFDQWVNTSRRTYYIKSDGTIATGKLFLDGTMEVFDENGDYLNSDSKDTEHLYIHSIDVGNADSHFIKLPNGQSVLIDTGLPETYKKLSEFLNSQDLKSKNGKPFIDYVILTHPHSDHIGGIESLVKDFNIGTLYIPKYFELEDYTQGVIRTPENSADYDMLKNEYKVYEQTIKAIKDNDINVVIAKSQDYIDDDKILQFVQSDNEYKLTQVNRITDKYWAINNNSLVVYLNYHNLHELFTGDIEEQTEYDFLNSNLLNGRTVNVLKVPHHGLNSSSSYSFIGALKPAIGIVPRAKESISTTNNPAQVYRVCGVNLYETSLNDGVTIYATEDNWTVGDLKK